jgi:O-antigen/teichoic acid export membrane protein
MAGTVLAGFLGYLFHFFVARKLTVSEYGEAQSIFALVAMSGVFASGFSYFVIKYSSLFAVKNDYSANNKFVAYLNKKILKVVIVISVLLLIFSPLIKDILHLSDAWGIVAGIIAVFFGTAVVAFQESLRAWQKFFALSIIGVSGAATKLLFGYSFASFFGKATPVVF